MKPETLSPGLADSSEATISHRARVARLLAPTIAVQFLGASTIYSLGIFMKPLQDQFGWSKSIISSSLSFGGLMAVFLSPLAGVIIDRIGSRFICVAGLALFCLATAAMSLTDGSLWSWWASSALVAFASVAMKPNMWLAGVLLEVRSRRGLAIGLALSGGAIGSALWPLIASHLIEAIGWRGAFRWIGGGGALICLPLAFLFYRPRLPVQGGGARGNVLDYWVPRDARQAMRSRAFALLALAAILMPAAIAAAMVHFVPMLMEKGVAWGDAATLGVALGIAAIAGRLVTGPLLDRANGPMLGAVSFCVPIIACALLLSSGAVTPVGAIFISISIGFCLGSEVDVMYYMTSRYFGARHAGLLFGAITGLVVVGSTTGPLLISLVRDADASYATAQVALIVMFLISAAMIAALGPYPER